MISKENELTILNTENFEATNVFISNVDLEGQKVLRVTKDPAIEAFDEPTYARLIGSEFHNGIIEVKVFSRLLENAPDFARGFIGVAFHMDQTNTKFESFYIRPTNGRSDEQIRRTRSVQYFSFPDYKFERLREECPGMYEAYADMGLNEWIDLKIEVNGPCAKFYINHSTQPVLVVNDLKLGKDETGSIGLWVDIGTEGFFKELKTTNYE